MKKIIILFFSLVSAWNLYSQTAIIYQSGIAGSENLKALENIDPNTVGARGFDFRYEGVKGTTRLFDTLYAASLLLKGQTRYIRLISDIDIVNNLLVYSQSGTKKIMEIPSDPIAELIVHKNDTSLIFRLANNISFETKIDGNKFCQILKESPNSFIRIPEKKFIKADFKKAYGGPDIRYDEFELIYRYYIENSDHIFQKVQLNQKSLIKMYPDRKELIRKYYKENPRDDAEKKFISILSQF